MSGCTASTAPARMLDHYLELLARKPGGLAALAAAGPGTRPRRLARAASTSCGPRCATATGSSEAARQMVDVLLLCREHGPARVELAVRGALAAGAIDGRAVAVLARRTSPAAPAPARRARRPAGRARPARARPHRLRPADRRITMTTAKNAQTAALEALIDAHAIELKLPTVRRRFRALAAEAVREQQTPVAYLAALLEAEMTERAERREKRRLIDARFPQIKRLEDFRFADNPKVPQATIAALAEGSWIDDREIVILIGDSGTGKTISPQRSAVCACQQGRRVRFTTLAALANELQEARAAARARPRRRPLRPHRARRPRRAGLPRPARRRRRARLPGPLRTPRTRHPDRHHQPPVRRMDQGVPRRPARQSRRRPAHPPSAHHRHRHRVLALPPRPRTHDKKT